MRGFRVVALGFALASAGLTGEAFAQTQFLVGARAGIAAPNALNLPVGPLGGLDLTVRMYRLVAAELTLDHSLHWIESRGRTLPAHLTVWSLGIQYRLDVAVVVPYATLAVEGRRLGIPLQGSDLGYGAAFAVGLLVPIGQRLFAGAEARYGIGNDGAFPTRQTYLVRFGWRNLAF